ncbi:MAG TPA: hydroxyphenylacetyl-CoA thioesterase PaaI [Burkholderiaceae bacterium]|nr:hydroxyphenylacetyl-CoA thioesterase PaaI [Burkholderiaceae bacterium]
MNEAPHHSHEERQRIAEAAAHGMFAKDIAARSLGMEIESIAPGQSRISMRVRPDMLNGFAICHGGFITTLADTAFAYACNSHNEVTVAAGIVVDFLAPAHDGDRLTADAREVAVKGRTGVYDITVTNQDNKTVAVMRGRSFTQKGKHIVAL